MDAWICLITANVDGGWIEVGYFRAPSSRDAALHRLLGFAYMNDAMHTPALTAVDSYIMLE